jgi:hypothetical protein
MMLLLSRVWTTVWSAALWLLHKLLVLCLALYVAYVAGWIHRLICYCAECEARKVLNGCTVTVGAIRYDLVQGRYWASNVVIHAPAQRVWKWKAPIFARIGKVYVESNTVQCLLSLFFLLEEIPVELYTVHLSDIQCFIERKHNMYNFFLLDPTMILPEIVPDNDVDEKAARSVEETASDGGIKERNPDFAGERGEDGNDATMSCSNNINAQHIVDDMLQAVRQAVATGEAGSL